MVIWTNHAKERFNQRGLTENLAWATFNKPDETIKGKSPGTYEFKKRFDTSEVTLIGALNEKGEWVILSCWINPIQRYSHHESSYNSYKTPPTSSGNKLFKFLRYLFWGKK